NPKYARRYVKHGAIISALKALGAHPEGVSSAELIAATGTSYGSIHVALAKHKRAGRIQRSGPRKSTRYHWTATSGPLDAAAFSPSPGEILTVARHSPRMSCQVRAPSDPMTRAYAVLREAVPIRGGRLPVR